MKQISDLQKMWIFRDNEKGNTNLEIFHLLEFVTIYFLKNNNE